MCCCDLRQRRAIICITEYSTLRLNLKQVSMIILLKKIWLCTAWMIVGKVDQVSKEIYNLLDFIPHKTQKLTFQHKNRVKLHQIMFCCFW